MVLANANIENLLDLSQNHYRYCMIIFNVVVPQLEKETHMTKNQQVKRQNMPKTKERKTQHLTKIKKMKETEPD
jgi:hypothetical protein